MSVILQDIAEKLSGLTVLEAAELAKLLEEKWGVSASPVAVAAVAAQGAVAEAAAEKTEFDVNLLGLVSDDKKLSVIKALREVDSKLTLPEAKALVESAPKPVKQGVSKEECKKTKDILEAAGAKIEVK
ncbi:50S ribosomal subunit protein L12 [Alphaproteobacteria bacterium]